MKSIPFRSPREAPAHLALRKAVGAAHLNVEALRDLMRLVNAHPELVAHARVFGNLAKLLTMEVFAEKNLGWAGAWAKEVTDWVAICDFVECSRYSLSVIGGLGKFNRQPNSGKLKHSADHPILHQGIVRHGIVGFVWIKHEATEIPIINSKEIESRYRQLQAHIVAMHAECRHRSISLEAYEDYAGDDEYPAWPMATAGISVAVREFSHNKYASVILQLPSSSSSVEFAHAIRLCNFILDDLPPEDIQLAWQYIQTIKRYCRRFLMALAGRMPKMRRRAHRRNYSGPHPTRPGFVSYAGIEGVFSKDLPSWRWEPESQALQGREIFTDEPDEDCNSIEAEEAAGLAPGESLDDPIVLIDPKDFKNHLLTIRRQRLTIESRAQQLPYDYAILTPTELRRIWRAADESIEGFLNGRVHPTAIEPFAIASMLLKLSLIFGQRLSTLCKCRIEWETDEKQTLPTNSCENDVGWQGCALVFRAKSRGDMESASFVGLRVPGLQPEYHSELDDKLDEINRRLVDSFVLPDVMRIGPQLLGILRRLLPFTASEVPFGFPVADIEAYAQTLCSRYSGLRATLDKIMMQLQLSTAHLCGDQTIAWMVTADETRRNEPRAHYTQAQVAQIVKNYVRTTQRLARSLGLTIPTLPQGNAFSQADTSHSIGARFVIETSELTSIVSRLVERLEDPRIDRRDRNQIIEYHNLYVLYSHLYQSFASGMRATQCPNCLFEQWIWLGRPLDELLGFIADKGSSIHEKARLISIHPGLLKQFVWVERHDRLMASQPWLQTKSANCAQQPFYLIDALLQIHPLLPKWVTHALDKVAGFAIPSNFHRAYMRSELMAQGVSGQVIDAWFGHSNLGERPFSMFSTFDFRIFREIVLPAIESLVSAAGFRPIESQIAMPARRRGGSNERIG